MSDLMHRAEEQQAEQELGTSFEQSPQVGKQAEVPIPAPHTPRSMKEDEVSLFPPVEAETAKPVKTLDKNLSKNATTTMGSKVRFQHAYPDCKC